VGRHPHREGGAAAALAFAKEFCDDTNRFRRWNLVRIARNHLFYAGIHDISVKSALETTSNGYTFRRVKRKGGRALVVDNCIAEGVDNEVSRLLKKKYEPLVHPTKLLPDLQAAADQGGDVLKYDLERVQKWPMVRHTATYDCVVGGTSVERGWLDEAPLEPVRLPHPDAVACVGCKAQFARRRVSMRDTDFATQTGLPHPTEPDQRVPFRGSDTLKLAEDLAPGAAPEYDMQVCPSCEGELVEQGASGDELESGTDMFGRELGHDLPRHVPRLQAVSIFEMYFENGGLGVEPSTARVFGRRSIEDLDWLASRYPEAAARFKKAELAEANRINPWTNQTGIQGASTQFKHHAIMTEIVALPLPGLDGLEMGRHIVIIGDEVVKNEDLMVPMECEGHDEPILVPRVTYQVARCKRKAGQMYGATPVDTAVPLNYAMDKVLTMIEDINERGKPFLAMPEGAELIYDEEAEGSFNEVRYRSTAPGFTPKDMIVNGQPINGNVFLPLVDRYRARIRESLGPGPAEGGENPVNTVTVGQLQINVEQSNQKRGDAEESLAKAHEATWRDHLARIWAFTQGASTYEVDDGTGAFAKKSFRATDLAGQVDVRIDAQAAQDDSLFQALTVENAVSKGWIDITNDQDAHDSAMTIMRVPKLNQQRSVQITRSNQAWAEFERSMLLPEEEEGSPLMPLIPVVDETLHDPWVRYQVLGKWWESDQGFNLQQKTGWLAVLPALAGWEKKLLEAERIDDAQRSIYENKPPDQWAVIYQQASEFRAKAQAIQEKVNAAAEAASQMPPPPPPMPEIPEPPNTGVFLPAAKQARVTMVMKSMVQALTQTPAPPDGHDQDAHAEAMAQHEALTGPVLAMLDMYATIQTYRLLDRDKKMAAAMVPGAPPSPTPGGDNAPGTPAVPAMGVAA
jgi:hypothetical protein